MFYTFIGRPIVSLGQLEQVCLESSGVPVDIDLPYVASHTVHIDDLDAEANFF
jgi:hypothetical protein